MIYQCKYCKRFKTGSPFHSSAVKPWLCDYHRSRVPVIARAEAKVSLSLFDELEQSAHVAERKTRRS